MTCAIRTERLTKRFGTAIALEDLDLEVEVGEVFGYLGPNGAGKSTTIALLLGFMSPTSGNVEVLGSDVRRNATGVHGRIGYVPSTADLWPSLTGAETLRFLGNVHGSLDENYRNELVERFGLEVDKLVRALSHGNRQKLLLIAAFASRPDLLILDEPTSGLDPLMSQVFQECIHEASDRGQTVLLSSHILSEVDAVCDRVAMLRRGRLIETLDLSTMRNLASTRVEAVLSHAMPLEVVQTLDSIPGVSGASIDDLRVRCVVNGPIGALLDTLLPYGVERLWTTEPSLEEMFVSRYDEPDSTPTPSAT